MKVSNLFITIGKAVRIFELYKNMNVDEALDKIYSDLKDYRKLLKGDENNAPNINFEELIGKLKNKGEQGTKEELDSYNKNDLVELAKTLGIKVSNSSSKNHVINEITNHFGYSQLNDRMAERNKA